MGKASTLKLKTFLGSVYLFRDSKRKKHPNGLKVEANICTLHGISFIVFGVYNASGSYLGAHKKPPIHCCAWMEFFQGHFDIFIKQEAS